MKRPLYGLMLAACLLVALFLLIYPLYVIRPFRAQGAGELAAALAILRFRPAAMVVLIALGGAAYWRGGRRWVSLFAAAGILLCAGLARVNVFEKMFHPVGQPVFAAIADSTLAGDEKVLAIASGDDARAYPVRSLAYHHIVNDVAGRVPVVATY